MNVIEFWKTLLNENIDSVSYWKKATVASVLLSFLWLVFLHFHNSYPFLTFYPWLRDMISNLNSTILFWNKGLLIYTRPTQELVSPIQGVTQELARFWDWNPNEFFQAPFWQNKKPLMIIWPQVPRPYPPGLFLSLSPVAAIMSITGGMNVLVYSITSWLYCFWGHLAFFSGWLLIKDYKSTFIKILLALLFYEELVGWSLSSQYDSYCLLFIFLALVSLKQEKPHWVFLNFSIATFIHFRALFWLFIPLLIYLNPIKIKNSNLYKNISSHKKIYLWGLLLSAISGLSFVLIFPSVSGAYRANPLRDMILIGDWSYKAWLYISLSIVTFYYGLFFRDFVLSLSILWLSVVLLNMKFLQVWYGLFFLPLLVIGINKQATWKEFIPRLSIYLSLNFCFLNYWPIEFIKKVSNFLVH